MKLFDIIEFSFLWSKPKYEVDNFKIIYLFQLVGASFIIWSVFASYGALLSISLLNSVSLKSPVFLKLFSSFVFSLFIGLFVSWLVMILISEFGDYKDLNLIEEINKFYVSFYNSYILMIDVSDEGSKDRNNEIKLKFLSTILIILLSGIISGGYLVLIYFIPFFVLFFINSFITVTIVAILSSSSTPMIVSLLICIITTPTLIILWFLWRRLNIKISESEKLKHKDYAFTTRDAETRLSQGNTIVCDGCRSFINSNRKNCNVCGDPVVKA